ncbi:hypothetical protein [Actinomyces sp. 565]|uniref:hypothetical protein n=1 Tax=Actinomyces sp. 565 TaxID=2057794 RepID=UPI0013A6C1DF|nr:hypothetical protein [Actinomyces sp. 565]NDR54811.1 hypothetical protein [Actinomyces sp. 565]
MTAVEPEQPRPPEPVRVATPDEARELAQLLLGAGREAPVVVVSTPLGSEAPWIDADALAHYGRGLVPVYLLETGRTSYAFADAMPEYTQVYGGAGRMYSPDLAWATDWSRSRLFLATDPESGRRATDGLIGELARILPRGQRPQATQSFKGTVRMLVPPSRALVEGAQENSPLAMISPEESVPALNVTVGQLVAAGQQVEGRHDATTGYLDVSASLRSAGQALDGLEAGEVILVRVAAMTPDELVVEPYPQVTVRIPKMSVTANPFDSLDDLFWIGAVVRARVDSTAGGLSLSMDDVDDDEPVRPAPSLLPGGPPWLEEAGEAAWEGADLVSGGADGMPAPEPRPGAAESPAAASRSDVAAEDRADRSVTVVPSPLGVGGVAEGDARGRRIIELERSLADARERLARLAERLDQEREQTDHLRMELSLTSQLYREATREVAQLTERLQHSMAQHRSASRRLAQRRSERDAARDETGRREDSARAEPLFLEPEDQLRHEIYLAWAQLTPPQDKAQWPLPADYIVGPGFIGSVDALEGVDHERVLRVVVEVLTGRVKDIPSRQLHRLRLNTHSGQARTRADGAVAFRVAVQVNTPSARRLHFWRLPDGRIELINVAVHDQIDI